MIGKNARFIWGRITMAAGDRFFSKESIDYIIASFPYGAHLKDSQTGKYIYTNKANLVFYNLSNVKELIGLTVRDLDDFMQPYWGSGFATEIAALEYQVIDKKERMFDERTIRTTSGRLMIQRMEKVPIIDNNGKASSILTMSHDLINELTVEELYFLYKKHNKDCKTRTAINDFLKHLRLENYFIQSPTESELLVLLAKKNCSSHKEVGKLLNLATKTVEAYSSKLAEKVKNGDVFAIVNILRNIRSY